MSTLTAVSLCLIISNASAAGNAPLPKHRIKIACKYSQDLLDAANANKIDPLLLAAVVYIESRWKPNAVSLANACGLTQVLPKYVPQSCKQLKSPRISLRVGANALRRWYKNRDIPTALACYNAGYICRKSKQARKYSKRVLQIENHLKKHAKAIE